MIYKLCKFLFDWDYIQWRNSADQGIARIRRDAMGNPYYFRYKCTNIIDRIQSPSEVIWLTCKPSKYAPEDET